MPLCHQWLQSLSNKCVWAFFQALGKLMHLLNASIAKKEPLALLLPQCVPRSLSAWPALLFTNSVTLQASQVKMMVKRHVFGHEWSYHWLYSLSWVFFFWLALTFKLNHSAVQMRIFGTICSRKLSIVPNQTCSTEDWMKTTFHFGRTLSVILHCQTWNWLNPLNTGRMPKIFLSRIQLLYCKLNGDSRGKKKQQKKQVVCEDLPNREGKIPWIALAGPSQETAVDAPGQQELLCLNSGDVGVEPPTESWKNRTNKWPFKYQSDPHFRISCKYSLQFVSPLPQFPLLWRQNKHPNTQCLMSQSSVSNLFFTVTFSQKWQFCNVGPVVFNRTALHFRVLFTYRPVGVNWHIMQ